MLKIYIFNILNYGDIVFFVKSTVQKIFVANTRVYAKYLLLFLCAMAKKYILNVDNIYLCYIYWYIDVVFEIINI